MILVFFALKLIKSYYNSFFRDYTLNNFTVKIVCKDEFERTFAGTGFFYRFNIREVRVDVIVTNKHVIEGAKEGYFRITLMDETGTVSESEKDIIRFDVNDFQSHWIFHPDYEVDLCIFLFQQIYNKLREIDREAGVAFFDERFLPDLDALKQYKPTEEIFMVGYPTGLGDEVNNLPLVRKGITATPFYVHHNGNPEFVVDCACFPGSSGSPVLIVNEGSFTNHKQTPQIGNRLIILGVLYAGPMYNVDGKVEKYNIPSFASDINVPMNLGYCIHISKLIDFIPVIEKLITNYSK